MTPKQVFEYAIGLKLDRSEDFPGMLIRMHRLMLMFPGNSSGMNDYRDGILVTILELIHWRDHNKTMYDIFCSNINVFNEEIGELSFSMLARCITGVKGSNPSSVDRCRNQYKTIKANMDVAADFASDTGFNFKKNDLSSYKQIKKDSEEVIITIAFFKQLIRLAAKNKLKQYGRKVDTYATTVEGYSAPDSDIKGFPRLFRSVIPDLKKNFAKAKGRIAAYWSVQPGIRQVWPEAKEVISDHSSDEEFAPLPEAAGDKPDSDVDVQAVSKETKRKHRKKKRPIPQPVIKHRKPPSTSRRKKRKKTVVVESSSSSDSDTSSNESKSVAHGKSGTGRRGRRKKRNASNGPFVREFAFEGSDETGYESDNSDMSS